MEWLRHLAAMLEVPGFDSQIQFLIHTLLIQALRGMAESSWNYVPAALMGDPGLFFSAAM